MESSTSKTLGLIKHPYLIREFGSDQSEFLCSSSASLV
ncbi:hypothetical protein JCM19241_5445 [Vibrio ishigakensis]|uniref:Uncharacterized protein n=1 Tax=Vibrio ishigakensis TaxID=1481914 RepID=A0A0B8QI27_9VIBR|nr:hypothetical protein JCM19241_5445 [Vibrio ishigakensis]